MSERIASVDLEAFAARILERAVTLRADTARGPKIASILLGAAERLELAAGLLALNERTAAAGKSGSDDRDNPAEIAQSATSPGKYGAAEVAVLDALDASLVSRGQIGSPGPGEYYLIRREP